MNENLDENEFVDSEEFEATNIDDEGIVDAEYAESEPKEPMTTRAQKLTMRAQRIASIIISQLFGPLGIALLITFVVFIISVGVISSTKIFGISDFNISCGSGGSSSVEISPDADDFTRQSAVAAWLTSTHFEQFGGPLSKEQAAGIIGNMKQESNGGRPGYIQTLSIGNDDYYKTCDNACVKEFNGVEGRAIGMLQWDGGRKVKMIEYAESQGKQWYDLNVQLDFMKQEFDGLEGFNLIAGGFIDKIHTPAEYAWKFNRIYERSADKEDSPAANVRRQYAEEFFKNYKGAGSFVSNCSGGSIDTTNLVQLAIQVSYPWSDYGSSWGREHGIPMCSTHVNCGQTYSKPEYIKAKEYAEEQTGADPLSGLLSSCDRFVATMLRATGVDTEFPWGSTREQIPYMDNSSKWERISCQDRQPGDVIGKVGHIMLYIGIVEGQDSLASASYMERTAAIGPVSCNGALWNADGSTDVQGWRYVGV